MEYSLVVTRVIEHEYLVKNAKDVDDAITTFKDYEMGLPAEVERTSENIISSNPYVTVYDPYGNEFERDVYEKA